MRKSRPRLEAAATRLPFSMNPIPPNILTSRTAPAPATAMRTRAARSCSTAMRLILLFEPRRQPVQGTAPALGMTRDRAEEGEPLMADHQLGAGAVGRDC